MSRMVELTCDVCGGRVEEGVALKSWWGICQQDSRILVLTYFEVTKNAQGLAIQKVVHCCGAECTGKATREAVDLLIASQVIERVTASGAVKGMEDREDQQEQARFYKAKAVEMAKQQAARDAAQQQAWKAGLVGQVGRGLLGSAPGGAPDSIQE